MGVYELSGAGSLKTGRTLYTSMNAGNQYGAMVPIASAVGTGSATTITFSNIPQTFQDLRLVISARATDAATSDLFVIALNAVGLGFSSGTYLDGNGSSATSARSGDYYGVEIGKIPGASATAGIYGTVTCDVLNYTNTTTFKTMLVRNAMDLNGSGITRLTVGLTRKDTTAIRQLDIFTYAGGNLTTDSTATLYGIRAVSS